VDGAPMARRASEYGDVLAQEIDQTAFALHDREQGHRRVPANAPSPRRRCRAPTPCARRRRGRRAWRGKGDAMMMGSRAPVVGQRKRQDTERDSDHSETKRRGRLRTGT
jgi:hypothetical protein